MVHILKQFWKEIWLLLCPFSHWNLSVWGQKRKAKVGLSGSLYDCSKSNQRPSSHFHQVELRSSKFHVTNFSESFYLMNKLHCQESVKILSSLIMQFLSINDIPPVPGETHPCTNRIWQLHRQQSLLRPHFCSEVNAFCLGGMTGPLRNVNPGKSQIWDSVTTQAHLRTVPRHPVGEEGNSSHFHLFRPKCIPVWGLRIFSCCLKIFLNNLKLLLFWSRSYAVYSRPEAGEQTGMLFMTVLNWELSCDLTPLLKQKAINLFSRCSCLFILCEWVNKWPKAKVLSLKRNKNSFSIGYKLILPQ